MLVHLIQMMTIVDFGSGHDLVQQAQTLDPALLAQFQNHVFSSFNTAINHFIASGQVWAFLIGLVLGYLVRGFTTYG